MSRRLIVMTGATSGIGAVAAARLMATGGRLIAGARGGGQVPGADVLPLDLASLASVRAFAAAVAASLGDRRIDALVLNAGIQSTNVAGRSADGFETTFAVNHLAHHLLLRRLMPHLAPSARIVITTSGTHDPAEKTGMPPPRHADARRLADPAADPDADRSPMTAGQRAYTASKLCNLMTARTLAASADAAAGGWTVIAYDPNAVAGTGLVRGYPWSVRLLVTLLRPLTPLLPIMNTLDAAGGALSGLATDAVVPPGRVYAALRRGRLTWPDPSPLARDDDAATRLWADTVALTGE